MKTERYDVIVLGGGFAGLTLALHLKREFPELSILVLERQRHPLRPAAHKVGESTVELAAHYLGDLLGLREHLEHAQIKKFGLRYFFSEGRKDIENIVEFGPRRPLPVPSYQLDRGILETFLGEEVRRVGIDFRDGASVGRLDVGSGRTDHAVGFRSGNSEYTASARWLIDASGRAGLLRQRFGLTRDNDHRVNAVWLRVDSRIDIDKWSGDRDWLSRCTPQERWRSTNHMMGPGYWVWLIPLSSGAHSIGIVADGTMHPLKDMASFDRALNWLRHRQPMVAEAISDRRDALMDFRFLRNYSYGCARAFSTNRWALTGEAAFFTDPFYSPGADFIAISNTYIVSLIGHDRQGLDLSPYVRAYEQIFLQLYENALSLVRHQYPLFGNARVLPMKALWDGTYYWGVLCQLAMNGRLADLELLQAVSAELTEIAELNARMQQFFLDWHSASAASNDRCILDRFELDWCTDLYATLLDKQVGARLISRLRKNCALLRDLANTMTTQAMSVDRCAHTRLYSRPASPPVRTFLA